MRIVETDNFPTDYCTERFVNIPKVSEERAKVIAKALNDSFSEDCKWYWKVVEDNYKLQTGFEP